MRIFIISILIAGTALFHFAPTDLMAAEYYVDGRSGSDNSNGSSGAPWASISKANDMLMPGDTAYIKAGTYEETIRPQRSGQSGKYITYTRYQNHEVIIGGIAIMNGADLSNRSWVKIDGLKFKDTNGHWIEFEPNGSHNIISNNSFEALKSSMGYEGLHLRGGADHNKILNNTLDAKCKPADLIRIFDSSFNLVENNFFGYASHSALGLSSSIGASFPSEYNVVRNNTIQNPYHHNLELFPSANHTLVEGNMILGAGSACGINDCPANACGYGAMQRPRNQHDGLKIASQYCIVRNNILVNNGAFYLASWEKNKIASHNRVYHNVSYGNYVGFATHTSELNPFSDNIVKNNIIAENIEVNFNFSEKIEESDNLFIWNNFYGSSSVRYKMKAGLASIEASYPEFQDNLSVNPGFKDAVDLDFTLRPDSAMIDAGAWLTTVTSSSGTGTAFTVSDSRYFSDGFGIVQGDTIQLQGQSVNMEIVKIDYNANKIVVDRQVSWKKGDGLSLAYSGNAPDIGAKEYGSGLPSSQPKSLESPVLKLIN